MAQELGCFRKWGVDVELVREPGWAAIRDKIAYGELDAAHSLAGICFAISWGLGVVKRPCVTGFLFNSHGDAITVSSELHEKGVSDAASLAQEAANWKRERPLVFGVPHLFSSHHFLLRHWLRPTGVAIGKDVEIIVLPPSQMAGCLEVGFIDGYCVGEPYNTEAVVKGSGVVVAESASLSPMHPEKALLVTKDFAEERADEHTALISALAEAASVCDTEEGRENVADLLSGDGYLGIDRETLRQSLFAGAANAKSSIQSEEFHLFHKMEVNRPSSEKASWIVNQMRLAGMLEGLERKDLPSVDEVFRDDIYTAAFSTKKPVVSAASRRKPSRGKTKRTISPS